MRINLLPIYYRPRIIVRRGLFITACRQCICSPWERPGIVLAAFLVWLVRDGLRFALYAFLITGLSPLWIPAFLLFIAGYGIYNYCLPLRWCVVIECAPEEIAALGLSLRDRVEPHERRSWQEAVAIPSTHPYGADHTREQRAKNNGRPDKIFKILTETIREPSWGEESTMLPGPIFYGGRLTMLWLAEKLHHARIPCFVALRSLHSSRHAALVRPETLCDDWPAAA